MKRFKNILCALSAEPSSLATLRRAVSLAENNQAQLTLVDSGNASASNGESADHSTLEELSAPYRQRLSINQIQLDGANPQALIGVVQRQGYDLLVKRAQPVPLTDKLMGTEDIRLLRACPCPVWLTRPDDLPNYNAIMAAIDYDPDQPTTLDAPLNQQILGLAASLALSEFAELSVVHVWEALGEGLVRTWSDDPAAAAGRYVGAEYARHRQVLERVHEVLATNLGRDACSYLAPHLHLQRGVPRDAIPEAATALRADLVIIGTTGRSGLSGWLIGNTAETILGRLGCSVLIVPPLRTSSPPSVC